PDQTIKQLFREQCQGPPGLLEQICALNSDMRINDHTTVEQIARQEGSVIPSFHAEDRGEVDQILHIEMPTFDTIVQTSIFWDIRHAIQTLQDGGSNTASKLSIVILPEQFSLTVYIPRAHHKCLIEKIGELPAIRSRNKTSIIVPGENSTTLMVSEAHDCDENQMCDVIFRVPQDLIICGATLQSDRIPDAIQLSQHDAQLRVDLINGTHRPANDLRLRCGDVIDLCVKSTIHAGWMTSDELDIALEAPRALNPMTLFCAPASWNVGASHLHFYNDIIPDYRAYNQVIWIIEVDQHWVQAEAYLHEEASNFAFTFPAESRILLQPLVNHLVNITGARDTQVSVHFYDQVAPQHMCGYHLVAVIYQRLTANCAPLQPAQRRVLSFHPLAADFDRAQYEARELWIAAQAHPHLIEFASRIRAWYLVRVAENRFPIQFIAAGAAPDDDVTMKPAEVKPASGGTSRASASPSTEAKDPWLKADP
ncbi:unnamed protein product, partial [Durusdinium trenchii]